MLSRKTTLVLGAGASVAVGYPVGSELRTRLLALSGAESQSSSIAAGLFEPQNMLQSFIDAFRESQLDSIDKFLARRPQYSDIGKRAIATVLKQCERKPRLFDDGHEDRWYRYLFNLLATESWEKVDLSNLSIVTFNYDRSLEHYMMWAMQSAFGVAQSDVLKKLKAMNIVHIYGTLGPVWPDEEGYNEYHGGATRDVVTNAAKSIRIIPEGRSDDEDICKARTWLSEADAIAFLGFGFDKTNLELLKATETCSEEIERLNVPVAAVVRRAVIATCKGMTNAERKAAYKFSAAGTGNRPMTYRLQAGPNVYANFMDCNCLALLRETLVLK